MPKRISITMLLAFLYLLSFLMSCIPKLDDAVEVLTRGDSQLFTNPPPGTDAPVTPSSTSTLVATSTEGSIPFNTLTPTSIPIEDVIGLSTEGPWLVYQKEIGQLYAVNADGASANPLGVFPYGWSKPYVGSLTNGLLAVMVEGEGELSHSVDIILIEFPSLEVKRRISLLAYGESTGDFDSGPEGPYSGIMSEPRWSPDGRYLAFVGSIDGPSADLYVYDSTFDQIRRLSSGKNHAEHPLWSPNGHWITHRELSANGMSVESLWAASVDGKEMKWLFSPEQGWEPWILEWIGDDSFICILRSAGGEQIIRYVDISNGTVAILFPEYLRGAPSVDPMTGVVAFSPMLGVLGVDPILKENGIYIVTPFSTTPKLVIKDDWGSRWDKGTGQFITHEECSDDPSPVIVFNYVGRTSCEVIKRIDKSPNDRWRLEFDSPPFFGSSSEIVVFDLNGNEIGVVPDVKDGVVFWELDETGFFILDDDSLFHVELPSLEVLLVDTNVVSEGMYLFLAPPNLPKLTFVDKK